METMSVSKFKAYALKVIDSVSKILKTNLRWVYTKTDLVFGFSPSEWSDGRAEKNQILVACPTCCSGGQLSPDKKRRGRYSGKIVFELLPKTILR